METLITVVLAVFAWETLRWLVAVMRKEQPNQVLGVAISPDAQKQLDFLHKATGFTAHKVAPELPFNGFLKIKGNPEAEEIERILYRFAASGYVFTKGEVLLGNISTITPRKQRIAKRRSQFIVIDGLKEGN